MYYQVPIIWLLLHQWQWVDKKNTWKIGFVWGIGHTLGILPSLALPSALIRQG